jgi:TDG/mug DNA glycosylase family protein
MARVRGFPPISRPDARILILGSMPSRESLAHRQYYAHPRNAFWPILTDLLQIEATAYEERVEQVKRRRVAIWDVLEACFRSGSLDSAIDDESLVTNDFSAFYTGHPNIERVFFNGAKAEAVYRRRVLPTLSGAAAALPLQRLPSTSPAHAGMSLQRKKAAWRVLIES